MERVDKILNAVNPIADPVALRAAPRPNAV